MLLVLNARGGCLHVILWLKRKCSRISFIAILLDVAVKALLFIQGTKYYCSHICSVLMEMKYTV